MSTQMLNPTAAALEAVVGANRVLDGGESRYLHDETEVRIGGRADAIVFPETTEEVARVIAWCYRHDVPIVPRGGGTGFAGGAVPLDGGAVLCLERMTRVRAFQPLLWRLHVEAGMPTARVRRLARDNGLVFPPDPGAAEQSQIGGNIATNAGGPHAFKYGVTGAWVTGIEAVVPPGDVIAVGGPIQKDVAGYDLKSLLVGSEGTLGVVTAAWLRLLPRPEASYPVAAVYESAEAGCAVIERILGSGIVPAALEYLDDGTIAAAGAAFPEPLPAAARFLVLAEADGSEAEARRTRADLIEVTADGASAVFAPERPGDVEALWRWAFPSRPIPVKRVLSSSRRARIAAGSRSLSAASTRARNAPCRPISITLTSRPPISATIDAPASGSARRSMLQSAATKTRKSTAAISPTYVKKTCAVRSSLIVCADRRGRLVRVRLRRREIVAKVSATKRMPVRLRSPCHCLPLI